MYIEILLALEGPGNGFPYGYLEIDCRKYARVVDDARIALDTQKALYGAFAILLILG